jgi:hypothetical protein
MSGCAAEILMHSDQLLCSVLTKPGVGVITAFRHFFAPLMEGIGRRPVVLIGTLFCMTTLPQRSPHPPDNSYLEDRSKLSTNADYT